MLLDGEHTITLPEPHQGQINIFNMAGRFKASRCGRRFGKTDCAIMLAAPMVARGAYIGWFAPDYKIQSEAFNEIRVALGSLVLTSNKIEGTIRTVTGGRVDFWTLENERAGRSRKYQRVIIDEAAFTKSNMMDIWERSIKPTLLDYAGDCYVFSNTNGIATDNFFWQICNEERHGFTQYHAPTWQNPHVPMRLPSETDAAWQVRRAAEIDRIIAENPPLVYQQEYLAEFVDWSGVAFFSLDYLTENEQPVEWPRSCDYVYATLDSAVKTGKEHDATGVTYWAQSKFTGHRLVVLDYDIVQIDGAMLEHWIPGVIRRCEELAMHCHARLGSIGVLCEDAASGMVLLQKARINRWPMHAIDTKLTSVGKDERAIAVSGYVYQRLVRISRYAFEKTVKYKGHARNHFLSQVTGFRIGVKDQEDDLLDCFTYGVSIGVGDSGGF